MSEQRPFDNVSLNYIVPLISIVLKQNGIGGLDADKSDEQVTLALEFLSFHTDACESTPKNILTVSIADLIHAKSLTHVYLVA